jgi:hypothetical protein
MKASTTWFEKVYFTSENNWEIRGTFGNSIYPLNFLCNFLASRHVIYNDSKGHIFGCLSLQILVLQLSSLHWVILILFFSKKKKWLFINGSKLDQEWWESSYSSITEALFHFSFHLGHWPEVCKNVFFLLYLMYLKKEIWQKASRIRKKKLYI